MQRKPKVFIGSSSEAIPYARSIHAELMRKAEVTPWFSGTFKANEYTMESLENKLNESDFAVFVFSPDDVGFIRDELYYVTRDNTLFEMGLFWGKLRRQRVFCVIPDVVNPKVLDLIETEPRGQVPKKVKPSTVTAYHLLSDLQGITLLRYETGHSNKQAAVSVACGEILENIEKLHIFEDPKLLFEQSKTQLNLQQRVLHFLLEYGENVVVKDENQKHEVLSEAIRNSFITSPPFHVTGAALWKKQGSDGIGQIAGNIMKRKFYSFSEHYTRVQEGQPAINIMDAFMHNSWNFSRAKQVAGVFMLCYPLDNGFALMLQVNGNIDLTLGQATDMYSQNQELFNTINQLVGGDSDE